MGNVLKTYLLLSEKSWHAELFRQLVDEVPANWFWISDKKEFVLDMLNHYNPDYIFIPHWSYLIPTEIFTKYNCIVFHMTDLPYGRGGSPLQNLIVRGHNETKISALKVTNGIDEGPIYLKRKLKLAGSAREIFSRSSEIIKGMIVEIINTSPEPKEQMGEPTFFKRRKPADSDLTHIETLTEIYNYIRMLDADGYPQAFIETKHVKFEFTNADFTDPENITANVRITKK